MVDPLGQGDLSAVPLFPLPNVVLFPRAVLPLHIFEERYKEMTADTLRGTRQVAMALLKPGWERDYYHKPAIEPVVCVGTILSHERLPDGKYNFLLQGHTRARVIREFGDRSYRLAQLEALPEISAMEIDLAQERDKLIALFDDSSLLATGIGRHFRELLGSSLQTRDIADLIAFSFLEDVKLKQSLLADGDIQRRVTRIVAAFIASRSEPHAAPFGYSTNPSMN